MILPYQILAAENEYPLVQFGSITDEVTIRGNLLGATGSAVTPSSSDCLDLAWEVYGDGDALLARFLHVESAYEFCHAITHADRFETMEEGFQLRAILKSRLVPMRAFVGGEEMPQ